MTIDEIQDVNIDKEDFRKEIESIVKKKRLSYIDAVMHYIESNGMEVELVAELVSGAILTRMEAEGEKLKMLKQPTTHRLPMIKRDDLRKIIQNEIKRI